MTQSATLEKSPALDRKILLGAEAVAVGAIHAGISTAYGYPGTPSTELLAYIIEHGEEHGKPHAAWCANEKTALEESLGTSFVGRRSLVAMKHVGLNVAADPFMSGALVAIQGGLVVAVADDPGMHSSQNEQDTRYLADFARVICLEPATLPEAYAMTREAFDLSEQFHIPVVVRLVTRLAHSRAAVELGEARGENSISKVKDPASWTLIPGNARRQWHSLVEAQSDFRNFTELTPYNTLRRVEGSRLGVITTGVARNYFEENLEDLSEPVGHLHIGAYPIPRDKIRELAQDVERILVLEEGYPYVERYLRGILPAGIRIEGKMSGQVPIEGELNADVVRSSLGLEANASLGLGSYAVPNRPPQLCQGCPHGNAYEALREAVGDPDNAVVASDVGCYALGALPPYSAIETCVCMGASIGIAKGAAEAGFRPALAVIGDSTFLHSGVTPLMDVVSADADVTVIILDNDSVAMTGNQPTLLPSSRLESIVLGVGVDPAHMHTLRAHPKKVHEHAEIIRREMDHQGPSVIIMARECLEKARKRKAAERSKS